MLTKENIRNIATGINKPELMIEKDYVLEWLLYGIYHKDSPLKDLMAFKGGTSLRKVFYPKSWRFSDDLDFTLIPDADPDAVSAGFERVFEILHKETEITYDHKIRVPKAGYAITAHVRFMGPLGARNKIKMDMSRRERLVDPMTRQMVTTDYGDLGNFPILCYSFNETVSEKIRGQMQRIKVRDYYDVWKLFSPDDHGIDVRTVGRMTKQKCENNNQTYDPSQIFDPARRPALDEYWDVEMERLAVDDLPELGEVLEVMPRLLDFLPPK